MAFGDGLMIRSSHTLVGDYEFISKYDDAVDTEAADFEHRWQLYVDGADKPPLKPDAEPTYIKLRHLKDSERIAAFELGERDGGALLLVARMALLGVRGFEIDGKPYEPKFGTIRYAGDKYRAVTRESLDELPGQIQLEIGTVALARSNLRPS